MTSKKDGAPARPLAAAGPGKPGTSWGERATAHGDSGKSLSEETTSLSEEGTSAAASRTVCPPFARQDSAVRLLRSRHVGDGNWEIDKVGTPVPLDIHIERREEGLALSVEPSRYRVVRESLLVPVVLVVVACACILQLMLALVHPSMALLALPIGWLGVRMFRDWRQNAGMVTRIEVRDGLLVWQRKTLWGDFEHRWELASITDVRKEGPMLVIRRKGGLPMGAFSFRNPDALERAASALRKEIFRGALAA